MRSPGIRYLKHSKINIVMGLILSYTSKYSHVVVVGISLHRRCISKTKYGILNIRYNEKSEYEVVDNMKAF